MSSSRNKPSGSFGEFSNVVKSPKKQTSPQQRAVRKQQPRASRQDTSSSVGSGSSSKRSMEEDMMRLHPERFGSSRLQQEQRQQPNDSQDLPALESLFLKPRPSNGKVQVENNRTHRNTEVVLSNPPSDADGRRRKSVFGKSHKDKKQGKAKTKSKPSSPGPKNRLKMLNCFSSSGRQRDYEDEDRQQAAIQAYYQNYVTNNNLKEQNFDCYDEDDYGEGNSLAASLSMSMSMSVATEGSASVYKQNSPKKHDSKRSPVHRSHTNSAKEILDDLQEEDDELDSLHRRRSFLDMEEDFEKRDSIPREGEMSPLSVTSGGFRQPQTQSPPSKPQSSPKAHYRQPQTQSPPSKPQSPPKTQTHYHQQHQQRLSATSSVVQGKVTPPRGPVSTSWMQQKSGDGQSISFLSVGTGSTSATTTSLTTTSVVNPGQEQQQRHRNAAAAAATTNTIGPRCHFCGGPHWIYKCPHMDESALGRDQRRFGTPNSKPTRGYESEGSGNNDDSFATEGLNTTMDTTDTGRPSIGRTICGTQSHPLQCQVCFRR